jgi:HK97 family phage major capsid protein
MLKIFNLIKSLKAKGFATVAEKKELETEVAKTDAETQEAVKEDVAEVAKLPETDPAASDVNTEIEKGIGEIINAKVIALKSENKAEMQKAIADIKAEIKTFLQAEKDAVAKKAGIYHPDVAEKRKALNVYMREYAKALVDRDINSLVKLNKFSTTKELTTDATGSPYGGYVVDRELSAEIRHLITEYGVARREFMTVQLTKNGYDANALVTDVTVNWVNEASPIGSTQVVLGQEALTLKKLGAIVTMTRELLEDEEIDLFAFIGTRVAEGFARKEDEAFFLGEGSGDTANAEFTGIFFASGVGEVSMATADDAFADLNADYLLDMQDEAPQEIAKTGKYYMHRSILNLVRKLKDDQNAYIYQAPSESGPATIWGKSVVEVEVLPSTADSAADTAFVGFGNLKKSSILGYKGAISADLFDSGIVRNVANNADINLITTDRKAIRWVERVGAITILPTAFVVLKTGAGS